MSDVVADTSTPASGPDYAPLNRYATFTNRARALLIDTAVVFGAFIALLLLEDATEGIPGSGRIVLALMAGLLFLYEPLLISRRGATIGHARTHLQVVDAATGRRPTFARALARYVVKMALGLPSFVTMALTRQHQAVHDILTRTTVQLSSTADPEIHDFHVAREESDALMLPSRGRRGLLIVLYLFAIFVAYAFVLVTVDTAGCAQSHSCVGGTRIIIEGLALAWLALSLGAVVAGWKGLLPGARLTSSATVGPLNDDG